jgi:hypothetical protein
MTLQKGLSSPGKETTAKRERSVLKMFAVGLLSWMCFHQNVEGRHR